jgi:translocator assembly and maintenance protein 41
MTNEILKNKIEDFINAKPSVIDVIGYGSAVKTQTNSTDKIKKQIDIIAMVDDAVNWHLENNSLNPHEYNLLAKYLIAKLMHLGTDAEYISNISYEDNYFKIGIIGKDDFLCDLYNWSNFFMAGRMQKPIMILSDDKNLTNAIYTNRLNALRTSLILAYQKRITEEELYKIICSLSYLGDIRMSFKMENPHKINNIVFGEFFEFQKIYGEVNEDLFTIKNGYVKANISKLLNEIPNLPSELLAYIIKNKVDIDNINNKNDLAKLKTIIIRYLKSINFKSSVSETFKSAAINNFDSSKEYLKAKRKKYLLNK